MRDVIQKVLATEAEAKRLLAAARSEADRITAEARNQGRELLARTRQDAGVQAEGLVDAAVRAAAQEKQARLARAAAEIESGVRLDQTAWQGAVTAAVRCVCGQRQPARA